MTNELPKEIQRRLALLDALEAGGVENWEGYDFSTEEYRKTIGREETADDIACEIAEAVCGEIDQPAGYGCGYGITDRGFSLIVDIILKRCGELK